MTNTNEKNRESKSFSSKLILFLISTLICWFSYSFFNKSKNNQDDFPFGQWSGTVEEVGTRIVFNIEKNNTGYTATIDLPDNETENIIVESVQISGNQIYLNAPSIAVEYAGQVVDDQIIGAINFMGLTKDMILHKGIVEKPLYSRIQEPRKPYSYYEEHVKFTNQKENITLAGTLTLPTGKGKFPVVILISGLGEQNRDGEVAGHKPFLVIADYLTRNGIGVLRYDDRGFAESEGKDVSEYSTTYHFAADAESALEYLKTRNDVDHQKIGLIGHSEGSIIASMVALRNKDIRYIVMLAGIGLPGKDMLIMNHISTAKAAGMSTDLLSKYNYLYLDLYRQALQSGTPEEVRSRLTKTFLSHIPGIQEIFPPNIDIDSYIEMNVNTITKPWMLDFLQIDPRSFLKKVSCPVLALGGSKDLVVVSEYHLKAIEKALHEGGNTSVTTKEFEGLNHQFQKCNTGLADEYIKIHETFSVDVLKYMVQWIKNDI